MTEHLGCCWPHESFEPYPWANPDCDECGGDGYVTDSDIFVEHLEQSYFSRCSCVAKGEYLPHVSDSAYEDRDSDGWLDGVTFLPARYIGPALEPDKVTSIVIHSLWKGKHSAGPRYFSSAPDGRIVSAHFVVHRPGWKRMITQCVTTKRVAWHAGNRQMNRSSIGIETDGPFGAETPLEHETMVTLVDLIRSLQALFPSLTHLRSHRSIRPDKRRDPGSWHDWSYYDGLGLEVVK